jgi:hypothetical protein
MGAHMPTSISGAAPIHQFYDPGVSSEEGAGGAGSAGYEGGSRGAGNAAPSRPPDQTDDRCFREEVKAALACGKLVRGFDMLQAIACVMDVATLASCLTDRTETPEP